MRRAGIIWLLVIVFAAGALVFMKQRVQAVEEALVRANHRLVKDQEALHVLKAEWTYLNRPGRLSRLAHKYLELQPVKPDQLVTMEQLSRRLPIRSQAEGSN